VLKVLIAEDDLMIADNVEEVLVGAGYEVCGIARTVIEAVELGRRHKPDLAVIDLRLADGGLGTEIVGQLSDDSLGILYATGNIAQITLTTANGHGCIAKPFRPEELLRGVEVVAEIISTGKASPPFPRGFRVLLAAPPNTGRTHA
jgi:DNA-binding response OmpR family regulator